MSSTARTWGCHNREPFHHRVLVQSGWTAAGGRNMVEIPSFGSRQCMYDLKRTDSRCESCRWVETVDEAALAQLNGVTT